MNLAKSVLNIKLKINRYSVAIWYLVFRIFNREETGPFYKYDSNNNNYFILTETKINLNNTVNFTIQSN